MDILTRLLILVLCFLIGYKSGELFGWWGLISAAVMVLIAVWVDVKLKEKGL